jgi:hypothetical protein
MRLPGYLQQVGDLRLAPNGNVVGDIRINWRHPGSWWMLVVAFVCAVRAAWRAR